MKEMHAINSRFDSLVSDLCREIDELKEDSAYWQKKYEDEREAHNKTLDNYGNSTKETVGQLLSLALRARDTPEGVLITPLNSITP
jgi:hypothetical protein